MIGPTTREQHKHCTNNLKEILESTDCACFHCGRRFKPDAIREWAKDNNGDTALCPHCCCDTVLGSAAGFALTDELLKTMHMEWIHGVNINPAVETLQPNPAYLTVPLEAFIGGVCQLYFQCDGHDSGEYMWVKVIGFAENEQEELRGVLDNDPLVLPLRCGEIFEFSRKEIIKFEAKQ